MFPFLKNIKLLVLCFIACLSFGQLLAQGVEELEEKKLKLESEIEYNSRILSEVREEKKESLGELSVLKEQLKKRETLISTLSEEVEEITENINQIETDIDSIKIVQTDLREQYAKMIRHAYKSNTNYNSLLFLLSAESFNDAYKRMKYIKYYNDDKKRKVESLTEITDTLKIKINDLEKGKEEQQILIDEKTDEVDKLDEEKKKIDDVVSKLKKRENELKRANEKKQSTIRQLESEIRSIINQAIAKDESLPEPPPAKVKLSSNFKNNKGKLPWPVQRGVITGKFGEQPHPVLKGIKTQNDGIEITATKGTTVYAVADGKVSQIIFSPAFQSAIIVQHGNYFTVYSNVKNVSIQKGQSIKQGDKIGAIHTNTKGKTELSFQVWKKTNKLDPQRWIVKR